MSKKEMELLNTTWPESIKKVLILPSGAKYFRCALQVNPFSYLKNNRGEDHGFSEQEYNSQLIDKCQKFVLFAEKNPLRAGLSNDAVLPRKKAESDSA